MEPADFKNFSYDDELQRAKWFKEDLDKGTVESLLYSTFPQWPAFFVLILRRSILFYCNNKTFMKRSRLY